MNSPSKHTAHVLDYWLFSTSLASLAKPIEYLTSGKLSINDKAKAYCKLMKWLNDWCLANKRRGYYNLVQRQYLLGKYGLILRGAEQFIVPKTHVCIFISQHIRIKPNQRDVVMRSNLSLRSRVMCVGNQTDKEHRNSHSANNSATQPD
jgi:hypothetical protein